MYQYPEFNDALSDNYMGILRVDTYIELYEDPEGVNRSMARDFEILQQFEGEEIEGLSIIQWNPFPIDNLGDEAWGLEIQFGQLPNDILATRTHAIFRLGKLGGMVSILRTDQVDDRMEIERIARVMEDKIRQIMHGEIDHPIEVIRPLNESAALP